MQRWQRLGIGILAVTATATITAASGGAQTPGPTDAAIDAIFEPWNRADSRGTLMTVAVSTVPSLAVGAPDQLFNLPTSTRRLDVSLDDRFVLLVPQVHAGEHPIAVWTAAIASAQR